MSNLGYFFEYHTLKALLESGHTVIDTHLLNVSNAPISDGDQKVINILKHILKDLEPQSFRVANPKIDNGNGNSSDFISATIGISCKAHNSVVKAPGMGSIYHRMTGQYMYEKILLDFKLIKLVRDQFLKEIKMDRQSFYRLLSEKEYTLLKEIDFTKELVQELYCFLMGKEKPRILQRNAKNITVFKLNQLKMPETLELVFENNQLKIHFDNGVSLQKRFKTCLNSKTPGRWYNLFKEEWSIISTPTWESLKEIHSLN